MVSISHVIWTQLSKTTCRNLTTYFKIGTKTIGVFQFFYAQRCCVCLYTIQSPNFRPNTLLSWGVIIKSIVENNCTGLIMENILVDYLLLKAWPPAQAVGDFQLAGLGAPSGGARELTLRLLAPRLPAGPLQQHSQELPRPPAERPRLREVLPWNVPLLTLTDSPNATGEFFSAN